MELVKEQNRYLSDFESARERLTGQPEWFRTMREQAIGRFAKIGFPSQKEEAWRFTNVAPIRRTAFELPADGGAVSRAEVDRLDFVNLDCPQIVFVNGLFREDLSTLSDLPSGLQVTSLAQALREDSEILRVNFGRYATYDNHSFVALNTAFAEDGVFIHVPKGQTIETPVHAIFLTAPEEGPVRLHPRSLVVAENSSQITLVETYLGMADNVYLSNPVTEILLGDNATVDHYRLQNESRRAFHMGINEVHQGRDSNYVSHAFDLGAEIIRNDLTCVLNGEGGWAGINGLYLLNGVQHVDNYTTLEHAKAHCDSRELFNGILDEKAKGVFRGRIIVHKGAQKTDSKQTNRNLLLSDDALVNTKPQLEIYADDVKCTHGATIGQLDETALFYLRSRGIPKKAARSLLIYAFASEIIDYVKVDLLKNQLVDYLTGWLPKGELVREVYEG